MKKTMWFWLLLVALIAVIVWIGATMTNSVVLPGKTEIVVETADGIPAETTVGQSAPLIIDYSDSSGFQPQTITIRKGQTVTWKNNSDAPVWPASAMHPTHSVYPTTGGCIGSTFDACKNLSNGESWSFQFDEIGSWKYHNHLRGGDYGIVIVQ